MKPLAITALLAALLPQAWTEEATAEEPAAPAAEAAAPTTTPRLLGTTLAERRADFRRVAAAAPLPESRETRVMLPLMTARLLAGQDPGPLLATWNDLVVDADRRSRARLAANPKDNNARNPFDKIAMIHGWFVTRDKVAFPPATVEAMKRYVNVYKHAKWFGYGALNYRLMNDGAGFLAAEQWPDLTDSDGLDAKGIQAATKERLFAQFDDIVRRNTDEYGAPTYLGINLSAMKMLADFAVDPDMRTRASMTLDAMLWQIAAAWNQGYYVTPGSRSKYFGTSMTGPDNPDTTPAVAWLCFGGGRPMAAHFNFPGAWWFGVEGRWQPPALMAAIANDRSQGSDHRAACRDKIRMTIRHEPGWSLASEWQELGSPSDGHVKECRRTMLKWLSDKPMSTFIPMQENPRRPYNLQEKVANAFGYGENPFTQVLQHQGTLIGVTNVPADYPYWVSYAPFTTAGAIIERQEREGWVLAHGGSVLFAFRYTAPAAWGKPRVKEQCDVLRCEVRTTGWVLQVANPSAYPGTSPGESLKRFGEAVVGKTRIDTSRLTGATPTLAVHDVADHDLELTWRTFKAPSAGLHRIDGKAVDYAAWPLLSNPWMQQDLGGTTLKIQHGDRTRTYRFDTWTVEDAPR